MNDETDKEKATENGEQHGSTPADESAEVHSGQVPEAGQDGPEALQDDGNGHSPSDGEADKEEPSESEPDEVEVPKHSEESSAVALPDGLQVCASDGGVCIRISQKYKGGWVALSGAQWEELFEQVKKAI